MSDISAIQHLHWRAGFGLSPAEWTTRLAWSRQEAVDDLFRRAAVPRTLPVDAPPPVTNMMGGADKAAALKAERQKVVQQNVAWLKRMGNPAASALRERMCLFWHGHFACEIKVGQLAGRYLNVLREHGLGSFRDLLLAVAREPAMIRYLNNQQNRKQQPNENFARELMELFTLGRGHYTERDVKEAARAFTGWSSDREGQYVFRPRLHDYGDKTFMGRQGPLGGEDIIDRILERREVAAFLCRKIYAHFVNHEVDEGRVRELAAAFFASGYDIGALMRQIFSSDWFYAPANRGNMIKAPVVLLAGMMRQLRIDRVADTGLIGLQRALGQILFRPPNVAGWPGGRYWIDNSTLTLRLNLPGAVLLAADLDRSLPDDLEAATRKQLRRLEVRLDLAPLRELAAAHPGRLAAYLLQVPAPAPTGVGAVTPQRLRQLMTLPEYQLC